MDKFTIPPDQSSYSLSDGNEVAFTQLDGGAGKYRSDISNSTSRLNVTWSFDQKGYNYFRVFYQYSTAKGALPFLMDLYVDDPFVLTEHECHFIPGSVKLVEQRGLAFKVAASLEIVPITIPTDNQNLAYIYGAFGDGFINYDDMFDKLITYEFPQDLA